MKTALLTFTYLHGNDLSGTPRMDRAVKFLKYYSNLQPRLGFDDIFISDNGGFFVHHLALRNAIPQMINIIANPLMDRGPGWDYLPCWRQHYDIRKLIYGGYDKIIAIDDDGYLLSDKIIKHIKQLSTGFETFWCPKFNFPEAAISILCKDAHPIFLDFTNKPMEYYNNTAPMELLMPYTSVNKGFNTDRFGENTPPSPQTPGMDGYFQCPGNIDMKAEDEP